MPADSVTDKADYSLYVATVVGQGGELSGCLVGFATQCSIEPVRFLVCISKANHTLGVALNSAGLALHLLGEDQVGLASLFGEETGDRTDKFDRCRWWPGAVTGAPVLNDCAAWAECTILDRFDVGDHEALLVEPVAGGDGDRSGSLTFHSLPRLDPGHPVDG